MPPYLPVLSISRSQNIRIGNGPGNAVPGQLQRQVDSDIPDPFYVDLGDGPSRRDLAHHLGVGAIVVVGPLSATNAGTSTFPTALDNLAIDGVATPYGSAISAIEQQIWPEYLVQGVTAAATISPDPRLGEQVIVTPALTAALQFTNPPLASQKVGRRLRLVWTQDATGGRVVTFDTNYRPGSTAPGTVANKVYAQSFIWDGVFWSASSPPVQLT